ncbi:glycosyltransferase family 2 protein [Paenibacillus nanensis]|uniref:Glycosyltransferase family 2 protein n=1 Tax=Paenibacillus nanensis TaxID=393251 RepID=A0A3A1UM49_9BACL|nr:glycosyltransferase [Paenibacillus nanensis]RIX49239.1 glycosyltransferase family 2 protein [Paenibacillus nanensis]
MRRIIGSIWPFKAKRNESKKEIMAIPKPDRRTLSKVPDPENIRSQDDRRSGEYSIRYVASFDVELSPASRGNRKTKWTVTASDVSATGILVEIPPDCGEWNTGEVYRLSFDIPPGAMPEGFESFVKLDAKLVRSFTSEDGRTMAAFEFTRPLPSYFKRKRWGYSVYTASSMLFAASLIVVLMRAESVIYFKYNFVLYLYSLIAAAFLLSRYLFGALHRDVPVNPEYTPGVSVIIPCFNEEEWIHRTIQSCINQDYPVDKLEVIVVDDRSTDGSVARMEEVIARIYNEAERFATKERLRLVVMPQNGGKREALVQGVRLAKHDLVVFVDSDSFLEPTAIRHLVQPFQDPKMGGVAGRTDVENKFTNGITKLQTVRYYIAFRIMKAAESYFDSVTCLSGPLSCYRKELVLKHADAWLNQKFFGRPATFGDDRAMTNFVLRTHRTGYQDTAVCSTIVPSRMKVFLKQQMRWKRSWLRESLIAGSFIWKKEPFMALFFYIGLIVPIAAPVIVLYNLIYVPLAHGVFPGTFLMGLLLMALLMSFAHLFFRKSRLWVFGIVFCLFYELVLLWQMPVAWVTFWKSTWGTRETPQDIEARERNEARKRKARKRFGLPF